MMFSFPPPMVKHIFYLALKPPYDSDKGTVELLDLGGMIRMVH